MLQNYLKTAWRQLLKNRGFSAINILGLAVGIACALLIIFHVKEELSYDKGYPKADRIFRITMEGRGEDTRWWAATAPLVGPELAKHFPEVVHSARFYRLPQQVLSYTAPNGQVKRFAEKDGLFADAAAIAVFDLSFVSGNPATALSGADGIVLTETFARKYFGSASPLGKIIQDDIAKRPLKVTGVLKDRGFPSHLQFDYLISMPTLRSYLDPQLLERRTWNGFYNYVLLDRPSSAAAVTARLSSFLTAFYAPTGETPQDILSGRRLHLQPITDIHLQTGLEKEMQAGSSITYVYVFSTAALLILLIAAVNFINMSMRRPLTA